MTLVIMAAGMGSRYGGLKQIDPIGPHGEFIVDYSIYDAIRAGFRKVVFIIKEENLEVFRSTVGARIEKAIQVEYVFQKIDTYVDPAIIPKDRTKPWGTAHAVLCCKDVVTDNFAVINADDYYGPESFQLIRDFFDSAESARNQAKSHFCMVGYILNNTLTENGYVSRGVCKTNDRHYLTSVTERTKIQRNAQGTPCYEENTTKYPLDPQTIVSMNCWGFTPTIFQEIGRKFPEFLQKNKDNLSKAEFFLPSVVEDSMLDDFCDVKVLHTTAKWYGVTYQEDKAGIVEFMRNCINRGIYPEKLWN